MTDIWFATNNKHKRQELEAIFAASGAKSFNLKSPAEAGLAFAPAETGSSFLENALIKARALYAVVHEPVIADDSGLCVDVLGGSPGIYSARYTGQSGGARHEALSDGERNSLLLAELGSNPQRSARFVCAMVLLLGGNWFFTTQETLEGEIITEVRGTGGFGYDPLLFIPSLGRTAAELSAHEKNTISHRAKAGRAVAALLNIV